MLVLLRRWDDYSKAKNASSNSASGSTESLQYGIAMSDSNSCRLLGFWRRWIVGFVDDRVFEGNRSSTHRYGGGIIERWACSCRCYGFCFSTRALGKKIAVIVTKIWIELHRFDYSLGRMLDLLDWAKDWERAEVRAAEWQSPLLVWVFCPSSQQKSFGIEWEVNLLLSWW